MTIEGPDPFDAYNPGVTLTPERRRQIEAFIAGLPLNNQNPYRAWPHIAEELLNEIDRLAGTRKTAPNREG